MDEDRKFVNGDKVALEALVVDDHDLNNIVVEIGGALRSLSRANLVAGQLVVSNAKAGKSKGNARDEAEKA